MSASPTIDGIASVVGPVSATLLVELREEARKHGALVWLDKDGSYTQLVNSLISSALEFPFPVYGYRGSFLELMFALDGQEDGVTMQPLILHMPGFNEDEIARTPLYELYRAGRRHRIALPTLIRNAAAGKVAPVETEAAIQGGLPDLAAADAWLGALLSGERGDPEPDLPVLSPQQLFDDLATGGPVAQRLDDPKIVHATFRYLERTLGLDQPWRSSLGSGQEADASALQFLVSSWALCVQFVHDLRRAPKDTFLIPLQDLPKGVVVASCDLADHIRNTHPEAYSRDADQIEADLYLESAEATAEDLGRIDTLRFEDKKVFNAALLALGEQRWEQAAQYASERTEERSFWVRRDRGRRTAWRLVALAAKLGLACARHANLLNGANGLAQAAERYAAGGYKVDRAQRQLEQACSQLHMVQLSDFPALRECVNGLRRVYRSWVDVQALAFNGLCREHGFLPEGQQKQRAIFDDVVRPAVEAGGPVAYFVVDALRFEMATELAERLASETGTKFKLRARYAELPSLTEVGMNVLAPVVRDGRLQLELDNDKIIGFRAGEVRIATPEARRKAMHERVGGETCPRLSLEELLEKDVASLRRSIARARLVVVHAEGLDKAGEKGVGLRHFEDELQRLHAAWVRLRDAGVQSFVMTADHGFLLQDETTRKPLAHGRKTDPKRRHIIERIAADRDGEVRVSSTELGYDGEEVQFIFPESSMPFDVGSNTKDFLHGGNSLQERLIPVLTAEYRHAKGSATVQYLVEASAGPGIMGLHRINGRVHASLQKELLFSGKQEVELRLNALDGDEVAVGLVQSVGARIEAGALVAPVDQDFEILFRLTGSRALRTRVELCAAFGGEDVVPVTVERRFAVDIVGNAAVPAAEDAADTAWLQDLPQGGVRAVFEHIQQFGAINEADATEMLGGPRKFRSFSRQFEQFAERAPFEIRIDASSGQKRYVTEGI